MNRPIVSVLMSAYNAEDFLLDAVDSILFQSLEDFEFLIINDGSSDATGKILDELTDPRIRVFHQDNIGLTRSLNRGLAQAKGKYVARIDADDFSAPNRLEQQVLQLEANPSLGLLGTCWYEADLGTRTLQIRRRPSQHREIQRRLVLAGATFHHSSVVVPQRIFETIGPYNEAYRQGQDYDLWIRIAAQFDVAICPDLLTATRIGEGNVSVRQRGHLANFMMHHKFKKLALDSLHESGLGYKDVLWADARYAISPRTLGKVLFPRTVAQLRRHLKPRLGPPVESPPWIDAAALRRGQPRLYQPPM